MMDSTKTTLDLSTPESRRQFWKIGLLLSGVMALIPLYYLVLNLMGNGWGAEFRLYNLFRGVVNVIMAFLSHLAIVGAIAVCLRNTLAGKGDQAWPRLWSWLFLFGATIFVVRVLLDFVVEIALAPYQRNPWDFFEGFSLFAGYFDFFNIMLLGMALGMLLLRASWGLWGLFLLARLLFQVLASAVFYSGVESLEGSSTLNILIIPYLLTFVELFGFSLGMYFGMQKQQDAFVEASGVAISPVVVYAPRVLLGLYILATFGFHWEYLASMKGGGDSPLLLLRFLVMQVLLAAALSLWRYPTARTYRRWRSVFVVLTLLTLLGILFIALSTSWGWLHIATRVVGMFAYLTLAVLLSKDEDRLERAKLDALQKGI